MSARDPYVETEVKLVFPGTAAQARARIEAAGYVPRAPGVIEADQLYDRPNEELRQQGKLIRLRRAGSRATVTYKGPAAGGEYKSREEIEFDVDDADGFELVLERLGYVRRFRYEKFRTKFAMASEPGEITVDETLMGIFLELEGPAEWIDRTAVRLGFSKADYSTMSYATLYRDWRLKHPEAPENMTFNANGPG
jgi:adenylate cyclase class 2